MLKDSEEIIKRRKLSLMHATEDDTSTTTTTPPLTPPTPTPTSLNMMMMTTATHPTAITHSIPLTSATTPTTTAAAASQVVASASTSTPPSSTLTPTTMAATLLASSTAPAAVQDHYSLRWNNHQNHILRAFDALLQTKALVDVTLVCAETSIRAHKMVLSACSPFFQRVFAETPCKHPVIVLKDFRGWVVQAIVDFMYRGEISVPQERLQTLIQAGESLQVRGLVESSVPEHTPTPAASPDDFGSMIDTSLMSSELERCSSFDEESPSMVTAGSKIILPSRLFGASARRERERKRERELERELEREVEESDPELPHESSAHSDLCTSPMPRRKQARPRRRSGELSHELTVSKPTSPLPAEGTQDEPLQQLEQPEDPQTPPMCMGKENSQAQEHLDAFNAVIKRELAEPMDDDDVGGEGREHDSGNDSHENNQSPTNNINNESSTNLTSHEPAQSLDEEHHHFEGGDHTHDMDEDEEEEDEDEPEPEDIEELINNSNELRRKSHSGLSDGPEDLCTTKKDNTTDTSGHHSASDNEGSPANNNNNSKLNNNNRIVLSLKDIRHLNKPCSSSTPNSCNNMNPFAATSLRDLRLDRSAVENQCKMEALEAQMHAAAAAAAAAAANGENPFQHMEHQMDLSLAAAAAAAAVSHQQSRERDHAMQREHREMQQQHNAYANSLLGQMGMAGMPGHFGPGSGGPGSGQSAHERLEESMNRLSKEFTPSSPMSLPSHFNPPDGQPHPPSPLPFPGMSSALTLTPPHMFGLDSPLGLFPPGIDPGKLYNPLMEMSDPRGMGGDPPPFLKKKMPRPKGQHSAPRGGPPRSWTNAELTEALQHVWNKKMTTSQASRIFGIPYNSLLMYVRGKYGKSLKLEQLRKDCISGPPLELLQMGISSGGSSKNSKNQHNNSNDNGEGRESRKEQRGSSSADMDMSGPLSGGGGSSVGGHGGPRSASSEPDLLGGHNSIFNPFPQGFYPEFPGGFPGLPLGMLNLLPPSERHQHAAAAAAMHHMSGSMDEDCKSDRSKQSSMDEEFNGGVSVAAGSQQPLALSRDEQRRGASELLTGGAAAASSSAAGAQQNGPQQD